MPLQPISIKFAMIRDAAKINSMKNAIDETFKARDTGIDALQRWRNACTEFHNNFDRLSFPGGYSTIKSRIESQDENIAEYLLCFLECRPYFFRSGYMRSEFLKKIKRLQLTPEQAVRLQQVHEAIRQWRARKGNPPAA